MIIDNSTGANVRADINSALQALATNNSGSSAPSTTYALQTFANTNTSMLQLRNAANNAFVNLRKFDGTLPLPDGSAATPSLFFDDDTDTGIFSGGANQFQITTGGGQRLKLDSVETVFNDNGNNTDFRIESDTQPHMFFVDASTNRIGVNTDAPTHDFHVISGNTDLCKLETNNAGTTGAVLILSHSTASPADNDVTGRLSFRGKDDGGNEATFADISVIASDVSNGTESGKIVFRTNHNGTFGDRVTILSSGNVGIGASTVPTGFKLTVNGDLTLGESGGSDNTFIDQKQNGNLEIINSGRDDNAAGIRINRMNNIAGDTTYFRDVNIYNGKGTSVMYVDGSAASVGIGTESPAAKLHISGSEIRHENSSVPFIRLKATNAQSTNHFDYGRLLNDVAGTVTGLLDWKRQASTDDSYFTIFNKQSGSVIQERLRLTSAGTLCVHAGQQTNVNSMNNNTRSLPKFFENSAGQDSNLVAGDIHFESVIRVTGSTDDTLFTFQGGGNCGIYVEVTAYYSSAITGFQGRQRFAYRAHRTANNNFSTSTTGPYDGQGFETGSYFSPSFTSSSSGSSQVLGIRVQSQNMGAYVRILYHARLVTNDSIGSMTINR